MARAPALLSPPSSSAVPAGAGISERQAFRDDLPLGPATETIESGAACGGTCDLRTINLAGGSIIAEEFENPSSLDGVIIGGTGVFAGATGTYSGSVRIAHDRVSIVTLTGTLTYDP
jgi:hypothetical protein